MPMDKPDTNLDPVLQELHDKLDPYCEQVVKDMDYGVLVLGIKLLKDKKTLERNGLQTYFNVAGATNVMAEGLYSELASQIEAGDFAFFEMLSIIVRDLEDQFGLRTEADEFPEDVEDSTMH